MDSSRESDRLECISEAHAEFMRSIIERGNLRSQQAIERFLAAKLRSISQRVNDSEDNYGNLNQSLSTGIVDRL